MITILLQKILDVIKAYITSLNTKLTQIKDNLSELIVVKTAEGDIASFYTSIAKPLQAATFAIKATGGNGTPSTPVPIVGFSSANIKHTGKNIFDISQISSSSTAGLVYTVSGNKITWSGTATSSGWKTIYSFQFAKTGWYHFKMEGMTSERLLKGYVTVNNNSSFDFEVTSTEDTYRLALVNATAQTAYSGEISNIQITVGKGEETYDPYNANTHTIDLGQTVYGGNLDTQSGVLTITHGIITYNGSEDWTRTAGGSYYVNLSSMKSGVNMRGLCNRFEVGKNTQLNTIRLGNAEGNTDNQRIYLVDDGTNYADLTAWTTFLTNNNIDIVYPLATPVTIQLTPEEITAFIGSNNLWSDTNGNAKIEYLGKFQEEEPEEVIALNNIIVSQEET